MSDAAGPSVHFVTTGGAVDGQGHMSRAMSVAEALVVAGARVTIEMVRGAPTPSQAARLHELGVRVARSIRLTDRIADVVVVDLPDANRIGRRWTPEGLVVFDDRDAFRGAAAIVVQPSSPEWHGAARADRVLAGFEFAPIRSGSRELAARARDPHEPPQVVMCFGGSDPADVSNRLVPPVGEAVDAFVGTWPKGILRTVAVVGPAYAGELRPGPQWMVERDPRDLDVRLASATVAIVGGGTMKFEVAALGVPAILAAAADDQIDVGPAFAATGACRFIGDGRTVEPAIVVDAVVDLLGDADARSGMSNAGRRAVDGNGAQRVAAAIVELAASR